MKICITLEGSYPYVRGGVSSWAHNLIRANPQHEYILWVIGATSEDRGKFKYELPENVTAVHEVFMDDALKCSAARKDRRQFSEEEIVALRELVVCGNPDWDVLFRLYNEEKGNPAAFLMSQKFLDILLEICQKEYPHVAFADYFHTVRSMILPVLYLLTQSAPEADVYHGTATGYGGVLAAMGAWRYKRPYVLTEHGIYTREREEEILRAKWVIPYFRKQWIDMFYMLSRCAYQRADRVTSLFQRYSDMQVELGCDRNKRKIIENGIHLDRFGKIPLVKADDWIDIAAVVRLHPIKDVKSMIYAFFALKQRISKVRLHILGDADDEEYARECRDLIEQLQVPDIVMPGNVDVVQYLEQIDVTLLTSISEGQPLAILESLAAGRPCIATDVGCCRGLLEGDGRDDYGKAGIVVPTMHPQAIADAMERLILHPGIRKEMGEAGRKRVNRFFTHEDMVQKYNAMYEEVLSKWRELDSN